MGYSTEFVHNNDLMSITEFLWINESLIYWLSKHHPKLEFTGTPFGYICKEGKVQPSMQQRINWSIAMKDNCLKIRPEACDHLMSSMLRWLKLAIHNKEGDAEYWPKSCYSSVNSCVYSLLSHQFYIFSCYAINLSNIIKFIKDRFCLVVNIDSKPKIDFSN